METNGCESRPFKSCFLAPHALYFKVNLRKSFENFIIVRMFLQTSCAGGFLRREEARQHESRTHISAQEIAQPHK